MQQLKALLCSGIGEEEAGDGGAMPKGPPLLHGLEGKRLAVAAQWPRTLLCCLDRGGGRDWEQSAHTTVAIYPLGTPGLGH